MEIGAIVWLVLAAVLLVIEAMTVGLTTVWFAAGALLAGLAAYLGAGLVAQMIVFFVISLILLIFTRPVALRMMSKGVEKTNINTMIDKKAIVVEQIDNLRGTGKVRIQDVDWMARSAKEEECISEGNTVIVREVKGVTLFVEQI